VNADNLSIIDWLQMDQQFLHSARTAMNAYRQGQHARQEIDKRNADRRAG
jgi:hypothetical protein